MRKPIFRLESTRKTAIKRFVGAFSAVTLWSLAAGANEEAAPPLPKVPSRAQTKVIYDGPSLSSIASELRDSFERRSRGASDGETLLRALDYKSKVYASTSSKRVISYVRWGTPIRVGPPVPGRGCRGGSWHEVSGGGFICSASSFRAGVDGEPRATDVRGPALDRPLPYDYLEVVEPSHRRFDSLPNAGLVKKLIRRGDAGSGPLAGIIYFALDKEVKKHGRTFYRLINGNYVMKETVERVELSPMHGERLDEDDELPLAFVYRKTPAYEKKGKLAKPVGVARKHARFFVEDTRTIGDEEFVVTGEDYLVREEDVRIVRRARRPKQIPATADKWVSIDISEQTLTAYEDGRPVFATLVSTGKVGTATPLGVDRIHFKHVSTTMRGKDAEAGRYNIAEVPWTMFYRKHYAIHGAYWHNEFGTRQSHGCTNLAPADARWLFNWSEPERPEGWHSVWQRGTYVHFKP